MGIYLPNMEMPTNCPCELLGIGYDLYCSFAGGIPARVKEYYECCQNGSRPSWCPLVPVPPHGRLIDADALMEIIKAHDYPLRAHFNSTDNGMFTIGIQQAVDETPTIIPAEEGET